MKEVVRENILVELIDTQKEEDNFITKTSNGDKSEGVVIHVGGKVEEVKVGDTISWLTRASYDTFTVGDTKYSVVNEANVIWREVSKV